MCANSALRRLAEGRFIISSLLLLHMHIIICIVSYIVYEIGADMDPKRRTPETLEVV